MLPPDYRTQHTLRYRTDLLEKQDRRQTLELRNPEGLQQMSARTRAMTGGRIRADRRPCVPGFQDRASHWSLLPPRRYIHVPVIASRAYAHTPPAVKGKSRTDPLNIGGGEGSDPQYIALLLLRGKRGANILRIVITLWYQRQYGSFSANITGPDIPLPAHPTMAEILPTE